MPSVATSNKVKVNGATPPRYRGWFVGFANETIGDLGVAIGISFGNWCRVFEEWCCLFLVLFCSSRVWILWPNFPRKVTPFPTLLWSYFSFSKATRLPVPMFQYPLPHCWWARSCTSWYYKYPANCNLFCSSQQWLKLYHPHVLTARITLGWEL